MVEGCRKKGLADFLITQVICKAVTFTVASFVVGRKSLQKGRVFSVTCPPEFVHP